MFTGFHNDTIPFLLDLRFHNEPAFFNEASTQERYHSHLREPFIQLIDALAPTLQSIDKQIEIRPTKCMARIRRDIRFSKNKAPYRDHMWCLFRRGGEARDTCVTYWFELSPEVVEWGLGMWSNNRPAMEALRRRMRVHPSVIEEVLQQCRMPDTSFPYFDAHYKRMTIPDEVPSSLHDLYIQKFVGFKRIDVPFQLAYQPTLVNEIQTDFLRFAPFYTLLREVCDEGMHTLDP